MEREKRVPRAAGGEHGLFGCRKMAGPRCVCMSAGGPGEAAAGSQQEKKLGTVKKPLLTPRQDVRCSGGALSRRPAWALLP